MIGVEGGDSRGNRGSGRPRRSASDEEVGKIELYLSALGDVRGKRSPETEINVWISTIFSLIQ